MEFGSPQKTNSDDDVIFKPNNAVFIEKSGSSDLLKFSRSI